jgi:surfeit locus 1 family protein
VIAGDHPLPSTQRSVARLPSAAVYRFVLRPRWLLGHLVVIGLVVLMVNLGFWQLRRLDGRQEINASISARQKVPALDIGPLLTAGDPGAIEYRTATASGTFDPDHQVVVRTSGQSGDVVTALVMADGTAVLVDRGVVSAVGDRPAAPAPPAGPITITGRVRRSQPSSTGAVDELDRFDVARMGASLPYSVLPVYLELISPLPPGTNQPQAVIAPQLDDGPHLGYAGQWFLFSLGAIVGWPILIRTSAKRHTRDRLRAERAAAKAAATSAEPVTRP